MDNIKQRIIASASRQFQENGCKRITMDDVARELGISKRTLYEQFENKEALLEAVVKAMSAKMKRDMERLLSLSDSPLMHIMLIGRMHEHYASRYRFFGEDLRRYYPAVAERCTPPQQEAGVSMMEKFLREAHDRGYLRNGADLHISAQMLFYGLTTLQTVGKASLADRTRYINEFMINYMRGLLTIEAIAQYESHEEEYTTLLKNLKFD